MLFSHWLGHRLTAGLHVGRDVGDDLANAF
jgi:hypothetical protein